VKTVVQSDDRNYSLFTSLNVLNTTMTVGLTVQRLVGRGHVGGVRGHMKWTVTHYNAI